MEYWIFLTPHKRLPDRKETKAESNWLSTMAQHERRNNEGQLLCGWSNNMELITAGCYRLCLNYHWLSGC